MENYVVTKLDGTTYTLADISNYISEGKQVRTLLEEDFVEFEIKSSHLADYSIGDHLIVFNRIYKLNQLPEITKNGSRNYSVNIRFEGVQYDLAKVAFLLNTDTCNYSLQDVRGESLIGDISVFLNVIVANMNRIYPSTWVLGEYPSHTDSDTLLSFSEEDNCLSVLQTLCDVFDNEFDIEESLGINTINIRKRNVVFEKTFSYGSQNGLYELKRSNADSRNVITRLYVYGSTNNLMQNYRSDRLLLPGKTKRNSYIESAVQIAKYGLLEGRKYFDEIYPERTGTVSATDSANVLAVTDDSMFDLKELWQDNAADFSYYNFITGFENNTENYLNYQNNVVGTTKYIISGITAKIHFKSGNLAGYDFEIGDYESNTKTFTLKKITDERGQDYPDENNISFQVSVGDTYTLTDIMMPEVYLSDAERRLRIAANDYFQESNRPIVRYDLLIDEMFIKRYCNGVETVFNPGDSVVISDSSFVERNVNVRIKSVERNINNMYNYTLVLQDAGVYKRSRWNYTFEMQKINAAECVSRNVSSSALSRVSSTSDSTESFTSLHLKNYDNIQWCLFNRAEKFHTLNIDGDPKGSVNKFIMTNKGEIDTEINFVCTSGNVYSPKKSLNIAPQSSVVVTCYKVNETYFFEYSEELSWTEFEAYYLRINRESIWLNDSNGNSDEFQISSNVRWSVNIINN